MDVEVKETNLRLGHAAERIDIDAHELDERVFREASFLRTLERLQCPQVIVVDPCILLREPHRFQKAANGEDGPSELRTRLFERVSSADVTRRE